MNPTGFDVNRLREEFSKNKRVVIENFLDPTVAEQAFRVINKLPPSSWYSCAGFGNTKVEKRIIPSNVKKQVMGEKTAKKHFNAGAFSFSFHRNMGFRKGEITNVERMLRLLFSSQHLYNLIDDITGFKPVNYNQLFLSKYRIGHFLSPHSDINNGKLAYVLNLTKDWKPQYGGILHFLDNKRENITESFVPKFNSLVIFEVPDEGTPHFVSHVSVDKKPRYAVTGWLI